MAYRLVHQNIHRESKKLGHILRPITLEILNRSLQNGHKSRSLYAEHHAIIYLNQPWKIVVPSGE